MLKMLCNPEMAPTWMKSPMRSEYIELWASLTIVAKDKSSFHKLACTSNYDSTRVPSLASRPCFDPVQDLSKAADSLFKRDKTYEAAELVMQVLLC
jgi:hypothetical protein